MHNNCMHVSLWTHLPCIIVASMPTLLCEVVGYNLQHGSPKNRILPISQRTNPNHNSCIHVSLWTHLLCIISLSLKSWKSVTLVISISANSDAEKESVFSAEHQAMTKVLLASYFPLVNSRGTYSIITQLIGDQEKSADVLPVQRPGISSII